jgi:hypothetical protein
MDEKSINVHKIHTFLPKPDHPLTPSPKSDKPNLATVAPAKAITVNKYSSNKSKKGK